MYVWIDQAVISVHNYIQTQIQINPEDSFHPQKKATPKHSSSAILCLVSSQWGLPSVALLWVFIAFVSAAGVSLILQSLQALHCKQEKHKHRQLRLLSALWIMDRLSREWFCFLYYILIIFTHTWEQLQVKQTLL